MNAELGDVFAVRLTNQLGDHPVSLTTEGELSIEMEKVLSKMPGAEKNMIKAQYVLEINMNHPITSKLKMLYINDREKLGKYAKILYAQARLISGLDIENPSEYSRLICELL
jgi:molecular chaperone HtpG